MYVLKFIHTQYIPHRYMHTYVHTLIYIQLHLNSLLQYATVGQNNIIYMYVCAYVIRNTYVRMHRINISIYLRQCKRNIKNK